MSERDEFCNARHWAIHVLCDREPGHPTGSSHWSVQGLGRELKDTFIIEWKDRPDD